MKLTPTVTTAVSLLVCLAGLAPTPSQARQAAPAEQRVAVANGGLENGLAGFSASPARHVELSVSVGSRSGERALRVRTRRPVAVRIDTSSSAVPVTRGSTARATAWVRSPWAGQPVSIVLHERSGARAVQSRRTTVALTARAWTRLDVRMVTVREGSTLEVDVLAPRTRHVLGMRIDDVRLDAVPPRPTPPVDTSPGAGTLTNGCSYSQRGLPSCGAYAGSAYGANTDPATVEAQLGRRLGVRRTFWTGSQVDKAVATAKADVAHGRLPWISFKLPHSWEAMTAGQGDAWATDLARRLAAVPGPVWVAFHHEPEGDGNIQAWRTMQERLAPLVRAAAPNVAYTVVLTGWNQFFGASQYSLANIWPRGVKVDVAGFDLYNEYGVVKDGRTITTWPSFDRDYFAPIQAWAARQGVAWGVAETAYTDQGHARTPTWLTTTYDQLVARGGVAMTYFDTTLNAYGSWALSTASKRSAWAAPLRDSAALPVP